MSEPWCAECVVSFCGRGCAASCLLAMVPPHCSTHLVAHHVRPLPTPAGDALDENFDLSGSESGSGSEDDGSDEDGPGGLLSALDRRRQQRAAGDHPLQVCTSLTACLPN
jgi:hypothetical protein